MVTITRMEKIRHDAAYKAIFSNPEAVKSLILDFIPDEFVVDFDFSTLKKCPDSYITEDLRERVNDCIWQVQWKHTDCYLIIMLEFQSSDDHWMPLRILIYTGLLWSDLIAHDRIKPGELLPPVFPIVLYNGQKPWRGPTALKELIRKIHPILDAMQPNAGFRLVDEQRIPCQMLDQANGLAADIIRVEQARDPQEIINVLLKMNQAPALAGMEMQVATITAWLIGKIQAIAPDWHPAKELCMTLIEMFRKNVIPYIEQGREEGRKEGIREGEEKGRKEGEASATANLRNELLNELRQLLTTRFGDYPRVWEDLLEKVKDTGAIGRLLGLVYQVASVAEYEPALKAAATGRE